MSKTYTLSIWTCGDPEAELKIESLSEVDLEKYVRRIKLAKGFIEFKKTREFINGYAEETHGINCNCIEYFKYREEIIP
ncbi:MAG: hypothetical protein AB1478_11625 [Nitrospirota bacterium]